MKDILIIDEPELGLHPFAITVLGGLIGKQSMQKQILIATQSIELINEFSPENIMILDNNSKDGASHFLRLNPENLTA